MKTLASTVTGMTSTDYKKRFKAEYEQLYIRIFKLFNMLEKWKEGTLSFTPTCSYELLDRQLKAMETYRDCLKERAKIENIELVNPLV